MNFEPALVAPMETSLVLLKPDAVYRRYSGVRIIEELRKLADCEMVAFHVIDRVPEIVAKAHYFEHRERPFFGDLVSMLTSPIGVVAMVFKGKDVIKRIRAVAGPTMVERAASEAPNSARGKYGLVKGVNSIHASDSPFSGLREASMWSFSFGFDMDNKEKAEAAYAEYAAKYKTAKTDDEIVADNAALRKQCEKISKDIAELKDLLKKTCSSDMEDQTKELVKMLVRDLI